MDSHLARPPAIPLIVHDPGLSVWSFGDRLTDSWPKHWTGYDRGACIILRIDGTPWAALSPACERRMEQTRLEVTPTRTTFHLVGGGIALELSFLTPALPDDLAVLARPLSYVLLAIRSCDGRSHQVQAYLDIGHEWATDRINQPCVWMRHQVAGLQAMRVGTTQQAALVTSGDDLRTDWGYITLSVPQEARWRTAIATDRASFHAFVAGRDLPSNDDLDLPRAPTQGHHRMAAVCDFGAVAGEAVEAHALVAYDDGYAIEYLHRRLRPYWRHSCPDFAELLLRAERELPELRRRCAAFDARLMAECEGVGGTGYRDLCALAYRQAIGAHKLVADLDGTPLFFSKENFSNGCIATVDVTYPSAPLFLLINPALLAGMLSPVLAYAASPRWRFPFAPHDLGTFPLANGQVYGGGESGEDDQMPVEECGNLLILVAALCQAHGGPDYARPWARQLAGWADYLVEKGLDPEHQLCTDDFAGHLAHNTNLSLKAIIGIACWARLAGQLGDAAGEARYRQLAERMAGEWMRLADDGDHYRLTFDRPGTWSQKYNLVWDKVLGLGLFPAEVARREVAFYLRQQRRYGLQLDSRRTWTISAWIAMSATLAEHNQDLRALIEPLVRWANETPSRVPMTDWYDVESGEKAGFQARSVVGGLFMPVLAAQR